MKIYPEMRQGIYKKWSFHHVIWSVEKQLSRHNSSIVNEEGHVTDFFFNLDRNEANINSFGGGTL